MNRSFPQCTNPSPSRSNPRFAGRMGLLRFLRGLGALCPSLSMGPGQPNPFRAETRLSFSLDGIEQVKKVVRLR